MTPRVDAPRGRTLATTVLPGLLVLLAASCRAPAAAPTALDVPMPSAPSQVGSADLPATVVAARRPERLVVDGRLAEWEALASPETARSRVVIALTGEGLLVAADLRGAMREGIWLGLHAAPSELPPVGNYTAIGGSDAEPVMGVVEPGCPPPVEAPALDAVAPGASCLALRRVRAETERAHAHRFRRWYRVDPTGVRLLGEDGTLREMEGAKLAFQAQPEGASAEVAVPLSGLPRFAEAPVAAVWLAVRAAPTRMPPALPEPWAADAPPAEAWTPLTLPDPVAFEPLAVLRAQAFDLSQWMSFQPADPLHVEVMRYPSHADRRSFGTTTLPLYVQQAAVGSAEVGYLTIATRLHADDGGLSSHVALAVATGGTWSVVPFRGEPLQQIRRGGALHVLSLARDDEGYCFSRGPNPGLLGTTSTSWTGIGVEPDGSQHDLAIEGYSAGWEEVEPFHDQGSFGLRGTTSPCASGMTTAEDTAGQPLELRWRWDASTRSYRGGKTPVRRP